jgi:transcriptional regulator with XRE-family HTH domain
LALFEQQETMSLPGFHEIGPKTALELRTYIADRVRLERRRLGLNQKDFAERCGIPLRTYKRVEQAECDSLDAFLRIVICFERSVAIELLFPPKSAPVTEPRSAPALLERMKSRIQNVPNKK